jgi:hypothetical protein
VGSIKKEDVVQFQWDRIRTCLRYIVTVTFLVATCGASSEPRHAEASQADSVDDLPSQAWSLDIAFLRLNLAIPSFAGMYREKEAVKVTLGNMSEAEAARPIILKFLRENFASEFKEKSPPEIRFEPSKTKLNWFDIYHYKQALRDVLTIPDTVLLDADEVCGCVTVGISNERAREAVENFVKIAQVPTDAVRIVAMAPIVPLQSVDGQFRPIPGGVQIKNDAGGLLWLGLGGICTATMAAERFTIAGIVTASHCTRVQGGIEGTQFAQNGRQLFGLDYVGHESADPPWTAGGAGCPTGSLCRASDSAFAVIDIGNQNGEMDAIARPAILCLTSPAGVVPASCPLTMSSATAVLTVTGTAALPLAGAIVTKVGRTTGWTGGPITTTCANTTQAGTTFVALCTSLASAGSSPGDSGAPVFTIPPGTGALTATTATLVGLLWGGGGGSIAFSSIGAVVSDLAPIALFPPGPTTGPPPPPPSPCVVACRSARDSCMRSVGGAGAGRPRPADCVADYRECLADCRRPGRMGED